MKTAAVPHSSTTSTTTTTTTTPWNNSSTVVRSTTTANIENYVQQILDSFALSAPDESLGSYIISMLREKSQSQGPDDDDNNDALIELLQEHCDLEKDKAAEALQQIAFVVRTGQPPEYSSMLWSMGTLETSVLPTLTVDTTSLAASEEPPMSSTGQMISPLREDNLIPGDLWGALDETDESAATEIPPRFDSTRGQPIAVPPSTTSEDSFPPLGAATPVSAKKFPTKPSNKGSKKGNPKASAELAAALFKPSRVRHDSLDEAAAMPSSVLAAPASTTIGTHNSSSSISSEYNASYYESTPQFHSTVEILLSMNDEISEEAATKAAQVAQADINLAQYLLDTAMTAPPVCRHLLNDGCYRRDCQFSHDVMGHTCIFWLKGRCGKGETCRFLHGFNVKILQDIETRNANNEAVYRNQQQSYGNIADGIEPRSGNYTTTAWQPLSTVEQNLSVPTPSTPTFAKIASTRYEYASFAPDSNAIPPWTTTSSANSAPTVKIPQDLWTPHENRDAGAFLIADPMERYEFASKYVTRRDVIDLHFQSVKTFPAVLARVLPEKVAQFGQVWIVTGTGHHIGSNTHQKGGGLLESAVVSWLSEEGYFFSRGRDRNGQGGAILVDNR